MRWLGRNRRNPGWLALQLHKDSVELVHIRRGNGGKPQVTLCDSFAKEESDTSTLSRLRKELRLDRYRCTTLLGAEHYQLHEVDAPTVPQAELKAAVRWRVRDIIDYPLESATVDVLGIPEDPDASGVQAMVYAVAAHNDGIEACVRPYEDARIALEAIDIPELAQRNLAALFEPEDRGIAMLAFYAGEGMLTFTRGGELYISRRIEIPLAELLDEDAGQRKDHLDRIALEVQRSLDHFERQYHYVSLAKLLLAPLPQDIGLTEHLDSNIDGVVEAIDLATVMDLSAVPDLERPERQSQHLSLIGAALRSEEGAAA